MRPPRATQLRALGRRDGAWFVLLRGGALARGRRDALARVGLRPSGSVRKRRAAFRRVPYTGPHTTAFAW
eukprot:29388-Pelagococcus_subviridis.AAC.3